MSIDSEHYTPYVMCNKSHDDVHLQTAIDRRVCALYTTSTARVGGPDLYSVSTDNTSFALGLSEVSGQ